MSATASAGSAKVDGDAFDPNDRVRTSHTRWGLWDLYQQIPNQTWASLPGVKGFLRARQALHNGKYIGALLRLVLQQPSVPAAYLCLLLMVDVILPALGLWLSAQLLGVLTATMATRPEQQWLFFIAVSKVASNMLTTVLRGYSMRVEKVLQVRLKRHFIRHLTVARVRLDVPTSTDAANARLLESAHGRGAAEQAWTALETLSRIIMHLLSVLSSLGILAILMWQHRNLVPLVIAGFISPILETFETMTKGDRFDVVWAATCKDKRYIKLKGLQTTALMEEHKKEVVAGNLGAYIGAECDRLMEELGDDAVKDFTGFEYFNERYVDDCFQFKKLKYAILGDLAHILLIVEALRSPSELPLLMASYTIIQHAVQRVEGDLWTLTYTGQDITNGLNDVKALYEVVNIENQVVDGNEPFPENVQDTARNGVKIEFLNVSFKYPDTETYALREVSFTIERGNLAVIVGFNGSGKSTILKLLTRIYDPTEGQILLDGRDIATLRLFDLRETITCLFQDYSILPLSIRDNIGIGWPKRADDDEAIETAAKLANIDFEDKLAAGLDTYLKHPVRDHHANLPEGTTTIFGQKVDHQTFRGNMTSPRDITLSGGQSQKIAVARTIMRATSGHERVGILLFDEPSASMDPVAEYSLFESLRRMRGNKTMLFSSHRYGNLTRHAQIVFYMKDGRILERGTHDELMAMDGGGYKNMWNLQAEAFVS